MGKKIFVSYKYSDTNVRSLKGPLQECMEPTTVRDYVNVLQEQLEKQGDHINKGEKDGESLANFTNESIRSQLSDKIYDSSVTIVLLSPSMNETYFLEKDQWIPWEVKYSIQNKTRNNIQSKTNAILAIKLPNKIGSYDYDPKLFSILKRNQNNLQYVYPSRYRLDDLRSYIPIVNWSNFIGNVDSYIELSLEIWRNRDKYQISKTI